MDAPTYSRVNTLFQAGARVQQIFERHDWKFCFIGGVANFRWGTPRLTSDLDLTRTSSLHMDYPFASARVRHAVRRAAE